MKKLFTNLFTYVITICKGGDILYVILIMLMLLLCTCACSCVSWTSRVQKDNIVTVSFTPVQVHKDTIIIEQKSRKLFPKIVKPFKK